MTSSNYVDDTDYSHLIYTGDWDYDPTFEGAYDGTRHGMTSDGASVAFAFHGRNVIVKGIVNPSDKADQPTVIYQLDGVNVTSTALFPPAGSSGFNVTLYEAHMLFYPVHRLQIICEKCSGRSMLWLDYFIVDPPTPPQSTFMTPQSGYSSAPTSVDASSPVPMSTHSGSQSLDPAPSSLPPPSSDPTTPTRASMSGAYTESPTAPLSATAVDAHDPTGLGSSLGTEVAPPIVSTRVSLTTIVEHGTTSVRTLIASSGPTLDPVQDHASYIDVGAVVGGAIGGTVLVVIVFLLIVVRIRRQHATPAAVTRPSSFAESCTDVGDDWATGYLKFDDMAEVQRSTVHSPSQVLLVPNRASEALPS